MDFSLSDDQRLLCDSLNRVLDDLVTVDLIRTHAKGEADESVWQALIELGVPGLAISQSCGGSGLGMLEAALVAECLGRHAAPTPFIASCVIAPLALGRYASEEQKQHWLPRLAEGEITFGLAISEHTGGREAAGVHRDAAGLNGRSLFVIDSAADFYLVGSSDARLYIVDGEAVGLSHQQLVTVDTTRHFGELEFNNVEAIEITNANAESLSTLIDVARVMTAADTLGAAQHMQDAAVAYAKEREQFGRVIGSFQAVKHMCAEMVAALEPCRSMLWYAAYALDEIHDESHLYACHCKAHLSEVGTGVAKTATEVHGGVGFTDLLGLHYWFKRIGVNRQLLGSPERARLDAARAQGLA